MNINYCDYLVELCPAIKAVANIVQKSEYYYIIQFHNQVFKPSVKPSKVYKLTPPEVLPSNHIDSMYLYTQNPYCICYGIKSSLDDSIVYDYMIDWYDEKTCEYSNLIPLINDIFNLTHFFDKPELMREIRDSYYLLKFRVVLQELLITPPIGSFPGGSIYHIKRTEFDMKKM